MNLQEWWDQCFSSEQIHIPTSCPNIEEAANIWSHISPIIHANSPADVEESNYWSNIHSIVSKLTNKNDIPNPKSQISEFLNFLYQHRDIINPQKPEDCLPYINAYCPTPCNDFFVLEFPRSINNPMLALQTYHYMQKAKNKMWIEFISEKGAIGRLMDFYLPFLNPLIGQFNPIHWMYRIEMCDLIITLVSQHYQDIPLVDDFIISLNHQITLILTDAPPEYAADFVRYAIQLCKISLPRIKPETASKRLVNLLNAAPPISAAHGPIVRYAFKQLSEFITSDTLAKNIIHHGHISTADLEILASISNHPKSTMSSQTLIVRHLCSIMTLDPFYCRSAGILLGRILPKLKDLPSSDPPPLKTKIETKNDNEGSDDEEQETSKDTTTEPQITPQNWIETFLRRLTIFIAIANSRNKYAGRIAKIADILTHPMLQNTKWFTEEVKKNISILVSMNLHPPYFATLFAHVDDVDNEQWKNDYDIFNNEHVNRKRFPFATTGSLLLDPSKAKPKPKKKKGAGKKAAKATKEDGAGEDAPKEDGTAAPKKKMKRRKWVNP